MGNASGSNNTSGSNNVFVGQASGKNNIQGFRNVYIGDMCGENSKSSSNNVFVGCRSGLNNIKGFNNVYIGAECGANARSSNNNIFVGYKSGYNSSFITDIQVRVALDTVTNFSYVHSIDPMSVIQMEHSLYLEFDTIYGSMQMETLPNEAVSLFNFVFAPGADEQSVFDEEDTNVYKLF